MPKLQNALLAVGRFLLAALLCVAVVVTLLSFSLHSVFDRGSYINAAESDAFISALYTDVLEHLESECLFYDLPYDTIKTALPAQTVQAVAAARIEMFYNSLQSGNKLPPVELDPAPFKAAIDSFFETLPIEERPLDPDASQTIATELSQSTSLVMSIGISDKIVSTAHPIFADTSPLRRLANSGAWLWIALLLLAAVSMIPFGSAICKRFYSTAGALFIGSALVAAPVWLFTGLDFPSKLAIGDSALREFVSAVLYAVIHRTNTVVTAAFIISAALLITSVVWLVTDKKVNKVAS